MVVLILNLAIWFALHVLFREVGTVGFGPISIAWPRLGSADLPAMALSLIAAASLFWFKLGVLPTLWFCAALGMLVRWGGIA